MGLLQNPTARRQPLHPLQSRVATVLRVQPRLNNYKSTWLCCTRLHVCRRFGLCIGCEIHALFCHMSDEQRLVVGMLICDRQL